MTPAIHLSEAQASACGKAILLGEHAVVYGHPAIAMPLPDLRMSAKYQPNNGDSSEGMRVSMPSLGIEGRLADIPAASPIPKLIQATWETFGLPGSPTGSLDIRSQIPISSGLGSSAALAVCLVRLFANATSRELSVEEINSLAYELEKISHKNPSGIDNTVVTHEKPVVFSRSEGMRFLAPGKDLHFLLANTGRAKSTADTVADLARRRAADPARYDPMLEEISRLVRRAEAALTAAEATRLGSLMYENHALLRELDISSPELEALHWSALNAGALGAKLTGGGRGGNLLVLIDPVQRERITAELLTAGATEVHYAVLPKGGNTDD